MDQLRPTLRAFLIALLATALMATVRRFVFIQVFDFASPVMPFLLAVMVAAAVGGLQAGLFATVFGVGMITYLYNSDVVSQLLSTTRQMRMIMFFLLGGLISWGLESLHSARQRLEDRQRELEQEVRERQEAEATLAAEIHRREEIEMALREREERVRMAVESADIGTFDFNPITGKRQWSDRAKFMFGLSPDADVSDLSFLERVHPDDRERAQQAVGRALDPAGDGKYDIDLRLVMPDGATRWFVVKAQAFFEGEIPNRRPTRFIGTVLEVTERKQAEERLRASESRLHSIINNASAVIYLKDLQGRFLLINRRFEELSTHQQIIGKTDADLFPSDVVAKIQANDRQVMESGQPLEFEENVPLSDGLHTYLAVKFPVFDSAGKVAAVGGISTDISDRKKAADALRAEQEMLRHLIELQDQERQLVAYEIHDGLVQYATGALMQLEAIQGIVESKSLAEQIENVIGILRRTVEEGRRIISGIHATVLDHCGVVAAVEALIEDEGRTQVQIEFVKDESLGRMAAKTEQTLYRITQEALTNVRKHSQSNKARVELSRRGDHVQLKVRDWGVGFAPTANLNGVHGLRGMTERARIAGGQCTIKSSLGEGTEVIVDLPYMTGA